MLTRDEILELPMRSNNVLKAKTVGEYLTGITRIFITNLDELVNYMFTDEIRSWKIEVGEALMDAGLVSAEEDNIYNHPEYTEVNAVLLGLFTFAPNVKA